MNTFPDLVSESGYVRDDSFNQFIENFARNQNNHQSKDFKANFKFSGDDALLDKIITRFQSCKFKFNLI